MGKIVAILAICLTLPLAASKSSASESGITPLNDANSLLGSQVYIQIFKEERQLELYAKVQDKYRLVKSFPICKFSGGLVPSAPKGILRARRAFTKSTPAT